MSPPRGRRITSYNVCYTKLLRVDLAKTFASEITLEKGDKSGSAKTLIKVMKLGITMGTSVTVRCEGEDEEARITSYNVCYTKLLRSSLFVSSSR